MIRSRRQTHCRTHRLKGRNRISGERRNPREHPALLLMALGVDTRAITAMAKARPVSAKGARSCGKQGHEENMIVRT